LFAHDVGGRFTTFLRGIVFHLAHQRKPDNRASDAGPWQGVHLSQKAHRGSRPDDAAATGATVPHVALLASTPA
jgi:hypothetical protein